MVRSFQSRTVPRNIILECVELASRSPSAGKTQGWHLVLLEGSQTSRYWNISLPQEKRDSFAFPQLLKAPAIALVLADPDAYVQRYSEPDKVKTGLGEGAHAWVAPYWTIDASFATMTFLLALEDQGIGALFFAHAQEEQLRQEFGIPPAVQILGVLAMGYESEDSVQKGRSAGRQRRSAQNIIHEGRW